MNLILFDLDGTLYSSRDILPDAYRTGIEVFNQKQNQSVEVPGDDAIFNQVGKPPDDIYENLFPELSVEDRPVLQQEIFTDLLRRIQDGEGTLYEGTRDVLAELSKSRSIGLVTNAQTKYMKNVLSTHDLKDFFGLTLCNDDAPNGRKEEIVAQQLEHFEVPKSRTVLVGDRISDRRAAETHDIEFIGCRFGYGSPDVFKNVPSLNALPELLNRVTS